MTHQTQAQFTVAHVLLAIAANPMEFLQKAQILNIVEPDKGLYSAASLEMYGDNRQQQSYADTTTFGRKVVLSRAERGCTVFIETVRPQSRTKRLCDTIVLALAGAFNPWNMQFRGDGHAKGEFAAPNGIADAYLVIDEKPLYFDGDRINAKSWQFAQNRDGSYALHVITRDGNVMQAVNLEDAIRHGNADRVKFEIVQASTKQTRKVHDLLTLPNGGDKVQLITATPQGLYVGDQQITDVPSDQIQLDASSNNVFVHATDGRIHVFNVGKDGKLSSRSAPATQRIDFNETDTMQLLAGPAVHERDKPAILACSWKTGRSGALQPTAKIIPVQLQS